MIATAPPFSIQPPISTYQYNAFALGAIPRPDLDTVVDNNFIQLAAQENLADQVIPICFLPLISPVNYSACKLGLKLNYAPKSAGELLQALRSSLSKGFLIRLLVDDYYIPDRWTFGKTHRLHDILVVDHAGDDSFLLAGYRADDRYGFSTCTYAALASGYSATASQVGENGFIAFRYFASAAPEPDLRRMKEHLGCLLSSRAIAEEKTPSGAKLGLGLHGLAVFEAIDAYIGGVKPGQYIDKRVFYLLAEHAKAMQERSLRVQRSRGGPELQRIPGEAREVAGQLAFMSLRRGANRSSSYMDTMRTLCRRLKEHTRMAAEHLYEQL